MYLLHQDLDKTGDSRLFDRGQPGANLPLAGDQSELTLSASLAFVRVSRAKDYIDANIGAPIKRSEVAAKAFMSEFHFSRLFKAFFNVSPHRYHVQKKLEAGAFLLRHGDTPVSQIAFEVGFPELSSFSRAFKAAYKQSPTLFRLQARHSPPPTANAFGYTGHFGNKAYPNNPDTSGETNGALPNHA